MIFPDEAHHNSMCPRPPNNVLQLTSTITPPPIACRDATLRQGSYGPASAAIFVQ